MSKNARRTNKNKKNQLFQTMDGSRPIVWNNYYFLFFWSFQRFCSKHLFLFVLTAFVTILIDIWWPLQRFCWFWLIFGDPFSVFVDFDWLLVTVITFLKIRSQQRCNGQEKLIKTNKNAVRVTKNQSTSTQTLEGSP